MRHIITAAALMAAFATPVGAQTAGDYNDGIAVSIRAVTAPFYRNECRDAGGAGACKEVWYSETVGYTITARDGRECFIPLDMLRGAGVGKERAEKLQ
jgi:hypothetical protein